MRKSSDRPLERPGSRAPAPVLILLGSSRPYGNTRALADEVIAGGLDARVADLSARRIAPYDYDNHHQADDFLPLARAMTEARAIVFASPVYWYSMSAQMKLFFDRLTDLTDAHKPLGKALAGKSAFALATSGSAEAPAAFEPVFADTAGYFDMNWGGLLHARVGDDGVLTPRTRAKARDFARRIAAASAAPALA